MELMNRSDKPISFPWGQFTYSLDPQERMVIPNEAARAIMRRFGEKVCPVVAEAPEPSVVADTNEAPQRRVKQMKPSTDKE